MDWFMPVDELRHAQLPDWRAKGESGQVYIHLGRNAHTHARTTLVNFKRRLVPASLYHQKSESSISEKDLRY